MTLDELQSVTAPFKVRSVHNRREMATITGFTATDPLDKGSFGLIPPQPTVYFEGGGWCRVCDLLEHWNLLEPNP